MFFTSFKFLQFLAVTVAGWYIAPKKIRWIVLLIASLVFYYICDPRYLIFIGVAAISAYAAAMLTERENLRLERTLKEQKETLDKESRKRLKAKSKSRKKGILILCLVFVLLILCVTKYTNFIITNINSFLPFDDRIGTLDIIVPMGISFYTFKTCGYLIDVYRGTVKAEKNPLKLLLFVTFFPQLVQGPISRYSDLSKTLYGGAPFKVSDISRGLLRISWGFFKKLVVADRIVVAVRELVSANRYEGTFVFVAMMFYAFQLYCDFTGGIDIAIGAGRLVGIDMKENFDLPYFSRNIKEYWNRWHITMGTWFTDYIFYPVSVSSPMLKLSKWSRKHLGQSVGKRVPVYFSSLIVWFTTGLWHGAAWNFIVWGLMNFVVIMISQELEPLYAKFHGVLKLKDKAGYKVFEIIRTILLMSMIRMFDIYRDVPLTFQRVFSMFTKPDLRIFTNGDLMILGLDVKDYVILAIALVVILTVSIIKARRGRVFDNESFYLSFAAVSVLVIVTVIFGIYGQGYDPTQFIYNQF